MLILKRLVIFTFLLFFLSPSLGGAWDDKKTHPALTEEAINKTTDFKDVLISQLGFEKNFDEKLSNGKKPLSIIEWLTEGSRLEDEPLCRAANHFHNPWKEWDQSQLNDPRYLVDLFIDGECKDSPFAEKNSNISWATGIKDKEGNPMSSNINGLDTPEENEGRNWQVARKRYYSALTKSDPQEREEEFAETFLTLGYTIHLLEDMAVPAHTRNDFSRGHVKIIGCPSSVDGFKDFYECIKALSWLGNPFEGYLRDNPELVTALTEDGIILFTGEKTLTNLWDTDTYIEGTTPIDFTSQHLGLAEYTNANFVSNLNP